MKSFEDILKGREDRAKIISRYMVEHEVVVSVKANIPGENKNTYIAYLIVNAFSFLFRELYNDAFVFDFNDDGPYFIIPINSGDASKIKDQMVRIEETHFLGRFVDIDVYSKNKNISRDRKRSCYLCSDLAITCMREKRHSLNELNSYIEENVKEYYHDMIRNLVNDSILHELNLHPKFGLVTPKTSGSHKDMDYALMLNAKDAILPYFIRIFFFAAENEIDDIAIKTLKTIGLEAEEAMLKSTNNVNAYKGLIFNLGIIVASFAIKISRFDSRSIFQIAKDLGDKLFETANAEYETFGLKAYIDKMFPGIRGEVLSGFANVQKELRKLKSLNDFEKLKALVELITNVDDSTLLKRAGNINEYNKIKEKFKKLDVNSSTEIEKLNQECIEKSLSFGGSADLLVLLAFTHLLKRDFYFIIDTD